jgi:glycosyltransferase involved in cell wall biosynthesis
MWNIGGGATVMKHILQNTTVKRDKQLLFVSSWVDIPKSIASKFTVIKLNTPKNRVFQEFYDQIIAPYILLKYSIDRVICLNSIIPLMYPKRVDVFYQMRMFHFEDYDNILKKIKNKIGLWGIKKAHSIFVASIDHKNDLIKNIGNIQEEKIKVNYLGYSDSQSKLDQSINISEGYLLFTSVIRPYKNLDRLIYAYKYAHDRLEGNIPKLVVVGNIPNYKGIHKYMENIIEFIEKHELDNFIVFMGSKSHEDVIALMKASKALVFPTLYEGFGLPLLEAMANKVPVLTSNRSSLPEVGSDTVVYFNPESVEDMGNKILDLLNNGYDEELIEKAFLRSKFFEWGKTAEAIEKDHENIIYT